MYRLTKEQGYYQNMLLTNTVNNKQAVISYKYVTQVCYTVAKHDPNPFDRWNYEISQEIADEIIRMYLPIPMKNRKTHANASNEQQQAPAPVIDAYDVLFGRTTYN